MRPVPAGFGFSATAAEMIGRFSFRKAEQKTTEHGRHDVFRLCGCFDFSARLPCAFGEARRGACRVRQMAVLHSSWGLPCAAVVLSRLQHAELSHQRASGMEPASDQNWSPRRLPPMNGSIACLIPRFRQRSLMRPASRSERLRARSFLKPNMPRRRRRECFRSVDSKKMKVRGVQNILIAAADGLEGLPIAFETAFPENDVADAHRPSDSKQSGKNRAAPAASDLPAGTAPETSVHAPALLESSRAPTDAFEKPKINNFDEATPAAARASSCFQI